MKKETGFESIAKERIEQVVKHRRQVCNDRKYNKNELMKAAQFCITLDHNQWPRTWPKELRDKIRVKSLEDRYVIAGAFIAAEVDRLRGVDEWEFELTAEKYSDWDKLERFVKENESDIHTHYPGSLVDKTRSLISHYSRDAAQATARKLSMIEDMKLYVRGMIMAAEMIGMAGTHGEKAARLRGMIDLMNSTARKLEQGHEDEILESWRFSLFGRGDYPYQKILERHDELKRENEELKRQLAGKKEQTSTTEDRF